MAVEIFRFDDAGYAAWLRAHRHDGWVVKAGQRMTPAYLKLHTGSCDHINTLRPREHVDRRRLRQDLRAQPQRP